MTTLTFSSFGAGLKLFLLMGGLGAFFAGMAYLICRYPRFRRAQFREWGPRPRLAAALGILIFASFLMGGWTTSFSRFYGLATDGRNVTLRFYFPERAESYPVSKISKALRQSASPKARTFELALILADGRIRHSAALPKEPFDKALAPLNGRIAPGLAIAAPSF